MQYIVVAVLGYLIGSLPVAYFVTRLLTGRDIRNLGTGNAGVMNTVRQAGLPAGLIVFIAEGAKGVSAYTIGHAVAGRPEGELLGALAALIGVNWSLFLRFRGGRGTTLCAFVSIIISPWLILAALGLWMSVYFARHDNFLATRLNILGFPFLVLALKQSWTYFAFACVASTIVLLRHDRATDDHFQLAHQPIRRD
jgi:acyl phosphate:glycerol-3-phosphate acyltransferase